MRADLNALISLLQLLKLDYPTSDAKFCWRKSLGQSSSTSRTGAFYFALIIVDLKQYMEGTPKK